MDSKSSLVFNSLGIVTICLCMQAAKADDTYAQKGMPQDAPQQGMPQGMPMPPNMQSGQGNGQAMNGPFGQGGFGQGQGMPFNLENHPKIREMMQTNPEMARQMMEQMRKKMEMVRQNGGMPGQGMGQGMGQRMGSDGSNGGFAKPGQGKWGGPGQGGFANQGQGNWQGGQGNGQNPMNKKGGMGACTK
jgi:hypothetical protein